ncbi:MAG: carboxypeptidase regulatory-like domain-containing protein [Planctomycetes bacterium]|nr:carboxypeptidase regulatory-like domain-containing protein [Planctomycetota bacterium]MCC7173017.1 carboxypeptidase regulatory-like domain-containing protein [Planctomycetota bacterium]
MDESNAVAPSPSPVDAESAATDGTRRSLLPAAEVRAVDTTGLVVRVVDGDLGVALAGAEVRATDFFGGIDVVEGLESRGVAVVTDSSGAATIGSIESDDGLVVTCPGFIPAARLAESMALPIVLWRARSLWGFVIDASTNQPVIAAHIRLRGSRGAVEPSVWTDTAGAYRFEGLRGADERTLEIDVDGCLPIFDVVPARTELDVRHDVHVDFGATLRGVVVDAMSGSPVASARVNAWFVGADRETSRVVTTGSDGRFVVRGGRSDQAATIDVTAQSYVGSRLDWTADASQAAIRDVVMPVVRACAATCTVEFADAAMAGESAHLHVESIAQRGRVSTRAWRQCIPIAVDADITLVQQRAFSGFSTSPGQDVTIGALVPWCDYRVSASAPSVSVSMPLRFEEPGSTKSLRIGVPTGNVSVRGTVRVEPQPIECSVVWQALSADGWLVRREAACDRCGHYAIDGLDAGVIDVSVEVLVHGTPTPIEVGQRRIVTRAGERLLEDFDVVVHLDRVAGRVVRFDDRTAVGGVQVLARRIDGMNPLRTVSDAAGNFGFAVPRDQANAQWVLSVEDERYVAVEAYAWPGGHTDLVVEPVER